ncbi:MAG: FecR domain-containing protein [Candidatus Rifleibacteriota bacterium]
MNKNCLNNEQIQQLLDGNLHAQERKILNDHLSHCQTCQKELAAYQKIFDLSKEYAASQLEPKISNNRMNILMSHISSASERKSSSKKDISGFSYFKWLLASASALALIVLFFSSVNVEKSTKILQSSFDLENNQIETILQGSGQIMLNGQPVEKLSSIPSNQPVSLPPDALILVKSGNQKIRFSESAVFSLNRKEIKMAKGAAAFSLQSPHEGLTIRTPCATITPLGTELDVEAGKNVTRIQLKEGKIQIAGKTGVNRMMTEPGILYVDDKGVFSSNFPGTAAPENSFPSSPPVSIPSSATSGNEEGPGKLLDSF